MLQAQAWPGAAVGGSHGGGGQAGPVLLGAVGTWQEPAQGPLEVPHEEWVDDGVHGAVTVTQPCEDIEEAWGDAVAHGLEGRGASHLVPGQEHRPPHPAGTDTHKHTTRGSPLCPLPVPGLARSSGASPARPGCICPLRWPYLGYVGHKEGQPGHKEHAQQDA